MPVVFAGIAPHGGIAVPDAVAPEVAARAAATTAAFEEMGRRLASAEPDVVAIFTPHNVHVESAFAVITAGRCAGSLAGAPRPVNLDLPCDLDLGAAVLDELRGAGLPAVGVSYGGNNPAEAVMPMDWAVLIPLWFLGGRQAPARPILVVTPARDRPPGEHVEAGAALRRAAERLGRRLAVVASADHGHAHQAGGPYGFDPAAAVYDQRVQEILSGGDLGRLLELDPDLVAAAKADSWWQMLMLHGILAGPCRAELLSYEAPTYFGMLCAILSPQMRGAPGARRAHHSG
jgi:aromatic ring-opening dioxygenase LigB subunit